MTLCDTVGIFLTGVVSTAGAFVPVFLLMCVHFWVRKNSYKKDRKLLLKAMDAQDAITKISEDVLQNIYDSVGVKDFEGLTNLSNLERSRHLKLLSLADESLDHIIDGRQKSIRLSLDIAYIDNFSFGTYLGSLLDRRFPDKHFDSN